MAVLRFLCFPSTTSFSAEQSLLSLQKPSQSATLSPPSLALSTFSFSPSLPSTLPIKNTRPKSLFILRFSSSSSSATVSIETPELESGTEEELSQTRLIAQNVPWNSTSEDIRSLFEKHGTVVDVELSMHNKTRNRGLAFITMGSPEEALAALTNLESYEFEGRTLKVNYARTQKKKPSPTVSTKPVSPYNLFVANLSYEARAKDLREFFASGDGKVVSAEIIFHENPRRSSGYGFVSFSSREEAEAALSAFQGKMFMGRPIRMARSKRYLKKETKVSTQPEDASAEMNPDGEQSDKADVI